MRFTILLAALGIFGGSSAAATITFSGIDWGNYSSAGAHRAASWSYVAGNCSNTICPATGVYRDFFVFDLSALAAVQGVDVTDATLTLINPASVKLPLFNGGYRSPNMNVSGDPGQPADTFSVFDVSSTIASVRANQATGAAGAAIYNDLGSGASYGSALLTANLNKAGQNSVSIFFNQNGVDAVNSVLDPFGTPLFAVGGAFQDLPPINQVVNEHVFQHTWKGDVPTLTITYNIDPPAQVPEPASLAMTGSVLMIGGLLAGVRLLKK